MKFLYGLGGANVPVIKEYELADAGKKIEAGSILTCSTSGKITQNSSDEYIGIAAEDHSGKEDILNARANGKKIRVDITKDGVYSIPAPKLVACQTGTATTFICDGGFIYPDYIGHNLMLAQKGENSTNTDEIGTLRRVTSINADSSEYVFSITSGGVSCPGDVYAIVPDVGYIGGVGYSFTEFMVEDGNGRNLKVVGYNENDATLEVKLAATILD